MSKIIQLYYPTIKELQAMGYQPAGTDQSVYSQTVIDRHQNVPIDRYVGRLKVKTLKHDQDHVCGMNF